jgi:hypothetical protein
MAWQTVKYTLKSSCPMLVHNGRMANPLDKYAKMMKEVSGKRTKTDADYEQIAKIEFMAGLYMGVDGPIIPASNFDAMLINAAKKVKDGNAAKAGVFCLEHARIEYEGPRTADELWADERFRHTALVRVATAKVVRTRPVFGEWTAVVTINLEDGVVNAAQVDRWFQIAGAQVGLGDWRPQWGRFQASRL